MSPSDNNHGNPPGPPSPPPGPPAPPPGQQGKVPKRPHTIGGKECQPNEIEAVTLPNGRVLLKRQGDVTKLHGHLKDPKWKRKDVEDAFAACDATDEAAGAALERLRLLPVRKALAP